MENFFPRCYVFYEELSYLIFGDEFGNVKIWNCKSLFDHLELLNESH